MIATQTAPYLAAVLMAVVFDIFANMYITKSNGFKNKKFGIISIILVWLAFTCLAFAVRVIDLSVAYALWGAFGLLGTSIGGWILFGQKMRPLAWLGIIILVCGIFILYTS